MTTRFVFIVAALGTAGVRTVFALLAMLAFTTAYAHSASDAYLTLTLDKRPDGTVVVHGQWDIALRDLNFVLNVDDNGDGRITWAELRKHQAEIAKYAYTYLRVEAGGKACRIQPQRQMVSNHADGAYAALFFDIVCGGAPKRIALDYRLFFAIDPSHRGILVLHAGDNTATSLLSPENAKVDFTV
jgi:hypothetical protein